MKKQLIFLSLIGFSFLYIQNTQSQIYDGNVHYDSTGKAYYYADDGNAYYYPEEVQRQYQRNQQNDSIKSSATNPYLIIEKIEDCKQAYLKARQKAREYAKENNLKGLKRFSYAKVVDFANDGIMIEDRYTNGRVFIYTDDQEYATGEDFRGDFLYQKVGYYKYRTVMGNTNSIPAYKATEYRVAEIDKIGSMDTYLKDKSLPCCLCDHGNNSQNPLFGLYMDFENDGEPSFCMNEQGVIGKASFTCHGIRENSIYVADYTPEEWAKLQRGEEVYKKVVTDEEIAETQEEMREMFDTLNQLFR